MTETYFLTDSDFDEYLNKLTQASDPLLDPEESMYNDSTLLDELNEKYAGVFEKFNRQQKLYLLVCVASDLCCQCEYDEKHDITNPEITQLINTLHKELSTSDKESLMQALVNQARHRQVMPN